MSSYLFQNALLVTMNPGREVFRGNLLVVDDRIAAIQKNEARTEETLARTSAALPPPQRIEASAYILLPGFVQTHIHLCQTLFRNHAEDLTLLDWLRKKIWPFEAAHNESSMRTAARLGIAELLAGGSTTILDMGSVHHYHAAFEEAEQLGIRMVGGKCMMDAGDEVPPGLRETMEDSLRESAELMAQWHGAARGRLRYAYAPRFALSCSERLLREVGARAHSEGCMVHTHAAETAQEEELLLKTKRQRSVPYFKTVGIAGAHCCFAHGVQLHEAERQTLALDGTALAHCPGSNAKLASGIAPILELRRAGVKVGLGADGAPCNNNLDMFHEMRLAGFLQKLRHGAHAFPAQHIVEMATIVGAACLGWQRDLGSLEIGKKADLILLRRDQPHSAPSDEADIYAQIVYAAQARDVYLTMVEGRVCYQNGELVGLELEQMLARAKQELQQLLQRTDL
ncbi:5'-deoxyadenosine deaminase [candidate division KSB1 bacterium]|nr:5'-deoxyadenosine deaminase [candidate division KSB1 bacterium]